jgi:hypothetical protein
LDNNDELFDQSAHIYRVIIVVYSVAWALVLLPLSSGTVYLSKLMKAT